jgi:uncharacterized protein (TIGR01627 family)
MDLPPPPIPTIGPARILSVDPPVFLTGMAGGDYLGIARAFGERFGNVDAAFLVFPTWTIEQPGVAAAVRKFHQAHVARYPRHRFHFMGNTPREAELLRDVGLPAEFLNKNFTVSKGIFLPVPGATVEFDAIYNARFVLDKRHELAALVPRVGYVTYVEPEPHRLAEFNALSAATLARNPGHVVLNQMRDGAPVRMNHQQVNVQMARASVGLVLSESEGSSYCSMEYMLAGLPVVSTPSLGGRDVYFDSDFCIVCAPEPQAVSQAVAELERRNIPRAQVRDRTVEKILPPRARFLDLLQETVASLGGKFELTGPDWPFGNISGVPWAYYDSHLTLFVRSQRAALCRRLGVDPRLLVDAQLTVVEVEPIVAAIKSHPGCRLLVFGCGNDSAFWEAVNGEGETAFIEDNASWAEATRQRLSRSDIHVVDYGTRLSNWRSLLGAPTRKLRLELPQSVEARTWDVILVDGPAGWKPDQPGRMKSIYQASRLVARGGAVFVHDCEREVERTFSDSYLGEDRAFVEVRGRSVLRGFAF